MNSFIKKNKANFIKLPKSSLKASRINDEHELSDTDTHIRAALTNLL